MSEAGAAYEEALESPPGDEGPGPGRPDHAHLLVVRMLREGTPVRIPITGRSMSPFLRSGDEATVEPLGGLPPEPGEVIAYLRSGGRLVLHRLIGRHGARTLARGDAGLDPAEPLDPARILGRMTRAERCGRPLRLGFGPERRVLARLSRLGLLRILLLPLRLFGAQARSSEGSGTSG